MKTFLRFLIPKRAGLENRWWHRLVNVAIYSSTILLALCAFLVFSLSSNTWREYSYTAFSFEPTYASAKGAETAKPCDINETEGPGIFLSVVCDSDQVNAYDFIKRYNALVLNQYGSLTCSQVERNQDGSFTDSSLVCAREYLNLKPIRNDVAGRPRGDWLDLYFHTKAKREVKILYAALFQDLGMVILAILGWFIFWESIAYRTLLYVIFGNKTDRG